MRLPLFGPMFAIALTSKTGPRLEIVVWVTFGHRNVKAEVKEK